MLRLSRLFRWFRSRLASGLSGLRGFSVRFRLLAREPARRSSPYKSNRRPERTYRPYRIFSPSDGYSLSFFSGVLLFFFVVLTGLTGGVWLAWTHLETYLQEQNPVYALTILSRPQRVPLVAEPQGLVRQFLVEDGAFVRRGQTIAELIPVQGRVREGQRTDILAKLHLSIARMEAQLYDLSDVPLHPALEARDQADPWFASQLALERQKIKSLRGRLAELEQVKNEKIQTSRAHIAILEEALVGLERRKKELTNKNQTLERSPFGQISQFQLEQTLRSTVQTIEEHTQRIDKLEQEVRQSLANYHAQRERIATFLSRNLTKARTSLERVERSAGWKAELEADSLALRAPVSGLLHLETKPLPFDAVPRGLKLGSLWPEEHLTIRGFVQNPPPQARVGSTQVPARRRVYEMAQGEALPARTVYQAAEDRLVFLFDTPELSVRVRDRLEKEPRVPLYIQFAPPPNPLRRLADFVRQGNQNALIELRAAWAKGPG